VTRLHYIIIIVAAIIFALGTYLLALFNKQVEEETYVTAPVIVSQEVSSTTPVYELYSEDEVHTHDAINQLITADAASYTGNIADLPRYIKNAEIPPQPKEGYAMVAIIIDDVGVLPHMGERTVKELPSEVTLAFLPYGKATYELSEMARKEGHEVMIHLPMEPISPPSKTAPDPGPNALFVDDGLEIIRNNTRMNLEGLAHISVGVNNHMGSRFTSWKDGMQEVLQVVAGEGLMFVDSVTTRDSKVLDAAKEVGVPLLRRNVFLDHSKEKSDIFNALKKATRIAHENGSAIVIGHPYAETLEVLAKWIPLLEEEKIQLVPITALLNKTEKPQT